MRDGAEMVMAWEARCAGGRWEERERERERSDSDGRTRKRDAVVAD